MLTDITNYTNVDGFSTTPKNMVMRHIVFRLHEAPHIGDIGEHELKR